MRTRLTIIVALLLGLSACHLLPFDDYAPGGPGMSPVAPEMQDDGGTPEPTVGPPSDQPAAPDSDAGPVTPEPEVTPPGSSQVAPDAEIGPETPEPTVGPSSG